MSRRKDPAVAVMDYPQHGEPLETVRTVFTLAEAALKLRERPVNGATPLGTPRKPGRPRKQAEDAAATEVQ